MLDWGFPVGPIKLTDEVGIDVGAKVGKIMLNAFGDRMAPAGGHGEAHGGRALRPQERPRLLPLRRQEEEGRRRVGLCRCSASSRTTRASPSEDIAWRCSLQFVNEACRCFGEGILRSARDGDIGAVFGLGFPPFRGGPFRFVDQIGAKEVLGRLRELEKKHGPRFSPAPVLEEIARSGQTFHGDNPVKPGQSSRKRPPGVERVSRKRPKSQNFRLGF